MTLPQHAMWAPPNLVADLKRCILRSACRRSRFDGRHLFYNLAEVPAGGEILCSACVTATIVVAWSLLLFAVGHTQTDDGCLIVHRHSVQLDLIPARDVVLQIAHAP